MSDKACVERIDDHYDSTMETLRVLWAGYCNDDCPECLGSGYKDAIIPSDGKLDGGEEYNEEDLEKCPTCDGEGKLSEDTPEYGNLNEYGLSFDYCYSTRNSPGYFRYQLSWGGPSDEFRIYADKRGEYRWNIWKIEYWFMDWFDGAHKTLSGDDFKFMENLITGFFTECGSLDHEYEKAMENYEPEDEEDLDEEDEE